MGEGLAGTISVSQEIDLLTKAIPAPVCLLLIHDLSACSGYNIHLQDLAAGVQKYQETRELTLFSHSRCDGSRREEPDPVYINMEYGGGGTKHAQNIFALRPLSAGNLRRLIAIDIISDRTHILKNRARENVFRHSIAGCYSPVYYQL